MTATEIEFQAVEVPSVLAIQVHGKSGPDPASIGTAIQDAFGTMAGLVGRHSLMPTGAPRVIYDSYSAAGASLTLAMPVAAASARPADDPSLEMATLAATKAYRFTHHGPYCDLMRTYGGITDFMKAEGLMQSDADWARYMPMWEEYMNDPAQTPEADLLTYIYLPIR